jgi:hypothetical protein
MRGEASVRSTHPKDGIEKLAKGPKARRHAMRTIIAMGAAAMVLDLAGSVSADDERSTSTDDERSAGADDERPASGGTDTTGLEFGARFGFGLPLGSASAASGDDLNKLFSNMIPIWLDAGYRFTPKTYAGLYLMYGFGSVAGILNGMGCSTPGVSCSIQDTRFGADVHYHIMPDRPFDPWLGFGFGFEWVGFNVSSGNRNAGTGLSGWEFLNLQTGLDFKPHPNLGIGPFVTGTFAQYANLSADVNGQSQSASIANQALHGWLILGVRVAGDVPTDRKVRRQSPKPTRNDNGWD